MNGHSKAGVRLNEPGKRDDPSAVVRTLLDRSFGLLGDYVSSRSEADIVAAEIQECQTTIAVGASPADIEAVCLVCLDTCRDFLATSSNGEAERQQSFADLMGVAHSAMQDINGNKAMSGADVAASTGKFEAVLKMGTIAEVKSGLMAALAEFKAATDAHRQAFEETVGTYKAQIAELETGILRNDGEATMDALTGLPNRGSFDRTVQGLLEMPDTSFTLAILDVDRLRIVNEEHEHLAGDRVLLGIAQVLKSAARDVDLVARYGSDEFAVLMRDATLRQGESMVFNSVSAITHTRLTADDGRAVQFTMSGGVAELVPGDTAEKVSKRALAALALAKARGGNQIRTDRSGSVSSPVVGSRLRH